MIHRVRDSSSLKQLDSREKNSQVSLYSFYIDFRLSHMFADKNEFESTIHHNVLVTFNAFYFAYNFLFLKTSFNQ